MTCLSINTANSLYWPSKLSSKEFEIKSFPDFQFSSFASFIQAGQIANEENFIISGVVILFT